MTNRFVLTILKEVFMNITKLNKQLEAHIKQELLDTADYLYKEIDNVLELYQIEVDDRIVDALYESVDRNLNRILKNKLIVSLEHYIEQKANLAALKGCYLEDEDLEEEYPFLSESEEFEDSEITKI